MLLVVIVGLVLLGQLTCVSGILECIAYIYYIISVIPRIVQINHLIPVAECLDDILNILALQYHDSRKLSTDVPDVDTGIDWLVYLARYSPQCQAQSHFVVRSRLDIVENTEIIAGANQAFYCGTL